MRNRSIALFIASLLLISNAALAKNRATLSPFTQPPTIDGKLSPGEWDQAVRTVGFQSIEDYMATGFEPRTGYTLVGFTEDTIYFAVVSELPPDGKLITAENDRDAMATFSTDTIEIWLDPYRDEREAGKSTSAEGGLSFIQMFFNSSGSVWDARQDPSKGAPQMGWSGNWKLGNGIDKENNFWIAEASLPLADLGWSASTTIGRSIGVLVARNFHRDFNQVTWFPHKGGFSSWQEYPHLVLTKDQPTVRIESLGADFYNGRPEIELKVLNPGPARQAKVKLDIGSSTVPSVPDLQTLDLPANGAATYKFAVPANRLEATAAHNLKLLVSSADDKDVYLDYGIKRWTKKPERPWNVRTGPDPDAAFRFAYYPSYNFIRILVDTAALDEAAQKIKSGQLVLKSSAGAEVLKQAITWPADKTDTIQKISIPDLAEDTYTLTFTLDGQKEGLSRTFERKRFPFEGNSLGLSRNVYAPFTPIAVKDKDLSVVLRTYRNGGLGLWDAVQSQGRELLSGPMTLTADGNRSLAGQGKFTDVKPDAAIYEGQADDPAVKVSTRCTTEYDGCTKVEMTLAPGAESRELSSLWLDIPIKDSEASLWHASTASCRYNPAGYTPKGQGKVWESAQFSDGDWATTFRPYVWFGGEERGICWFADNDKGWVLDLESKIRPSALTLHRENGVLTLRVHLVQKPIKLTEPRKIVFGLMASPTKPMPDKWRRMLFHFPSPGYDVFSWMGSQYWGSSTLYADKYPKNGDLSILDAMGQERLGTQSPDFLKNWTARNLTDPELDATEREAAIGLANVSMHAARTAGKYFTVYWEVFWCTSYGAPETHIFQSEWDGGSWKQTLPTKVVKRTDCGGVGTANMARSYQDFACYWGAEFIRRGIGLYFDNIYPSRSADVDLTDAYVLPNGRVQASACMWARREYFKRIWVMSQELHPANFKTGVMHHMTNTHILPFTTFNDANLDLEWFYGPEPQQSKYPHDLLRAESLGRQTGNYPMALARIDRTESDEQKQFAARTRFGTMFVHEIRIDYLLAPEDALWNLLFKFGYGMDDCETFNYWDEKYPLKTSDDEQVKSIVLKRGGQLMIVLCTWNKDPATVKLTLDTAALKVTPSEILDAETGKPIASGPASNWEMKLGGYDVKELLLK